MTPGPSQSAVAAVARTRPLLERKRTALQRAIGRYLAHLAPADGAERKPEQREAAGQVLFAWLLDHVPGSGAVRPVTDGTGAHAGLEKLDVQDCARFGDGLAAVLKDELGREATPSLLSAWGDTYWALMRAARPRALALAA